MYNINRQLFSQNLCGMFLKRLNTQYPRHGLRVLVLYLLWVATAVSSTQVSDFPRGGRQGQLYREAGNVDVQDARSYKTGLGRR